MLLSPCLLHRSETVEHQYIETRGKSKLKTPMDMAFSSVSGWVPVLC